MHKPDGYVAHTMSRRTYLTLKVMMDVECDMFMAAEAVASTAIEHPEWNLDQRKTWAEWESA